MYSLNMNRVTIIGGGLTGILAAFQAHRLGARNVILYERFSQIGGIALPKLSGAGEIREGCIYFGPKGDPIRSLLELHGVEFEDFDNRFGSVSHGSDGPIYLKDFGGPALSASSIALTPLEGESLADRLACYDEELARPLAQYAKWHVGCDPAHLHNSAAVPLAMNRVFPDGINLEVLAQAKKEKPLADELFGIPRSLWNYSDNAQASVPVGGFNSLFKRCYKALQAIGVEVRESSLATPRKVLAEHAPGETIVWAASPIPLFKAVGLKVPTAPARKFATYTFDVRWTGQLPFYVQNFTAQGTCFRAYLYESGGRVFLTAECVEEDTIDELSRELHYLLEGFAGELTIGELLHKTLKPRWLYHSVDTISSLGKLRSTLDKRMGSEFVAGAWEAYSKGEKFVEVDAALRTARGARETRKAS